MVSKVNSCINTSNWGAHCCTVKLKEKEGAKLEDIATHDDTKTFNENINKIIRKVGKFTEIEGDNF